MKKIFLITMLSLTLLGCNHEKSLEKELKTKDNETSKAEKTPEILTKEPATSNLSAGYTKFYLPVDASNTYANSIFPNSYVDLYNLETSKEVLLNIAVLNVLDKKGDPVFTKNTNESRVPATLVLAVPEKYYEDLNNQHLIAIPKLR